jgi:predicted phage-related endonuclease
MNNAMEWGILLDDPVAQKWAGDNDFTVQNDNKIRFHKDYPFLHANIDRLILAGKDHGTMVLEVKTTIEWAYKKWQEDGLPIDYYCQVQHYLDVGGWEAGYVVVFITDKRELQHIYVERDPEFIIWKNERLVDFWYNHVLKQIPPEPQTSFDVIRLHPHIPGDKTADITGNRFMHDNVFQLAEASAKLKEYKKTCEDLTEKIKVYMKDSDTLIESDNVLVTWKQAKDSSHFNEKEFQKDHPDLYQQYNKSVPGSRRFLLKVTSGVEDG